MSLGKQSSKNSGEGANFNIGSGVNANMQGGYSQSGGQTGSQNQAQSTGSSFNQSQNQSLNQAQNQSTQDVWGAQSPYLADLYGQASDLTGQLTPQYQQQAQQASQMISDVQDSGMDAWKKQLQGGAYGDQGMDQRLTSSLAQNLTDPTQAMTAAGNLDTSATQAQQFAQNAGQNNYQTQMKNAMLSDAERAQNLMLANTDARAAASGMSGGSRQGVLQSMGMNDINRNLQNKMADVGYNAFETAAGRGMQGASMTDQRNMQNAGLQMQADQQCRPV